MYIVETHLDLLLTIPQTMQNTERNSWPNKLTCSCTNNNFQSIFHHQGTPVRSSVPTRGAKNGSPSEYSSSPMGTSGSLDEGAGGRTPVPSYPVQLMEEIWPSTTYDGEQPCKSRVYPCFMLIDFFSWCGSKMPFAPHSWVRSQVKRFNINKPETKKTSRQIRKFESSEGVFCDDFNPKKPLKEHSSSSVN